MMNIPDVPDEGDLIIDTDDNFSDIPYRGSVPCDNSAICGENGHDVREGSDRHEDEIRSI